MYHNYRPHPKGEGNIFSLFVSPHPRGGGLHKSQVLSQVSGTGPFFGGGVGRVPQSQVLSQVLPGGTPVTGSFPGPLGGGYPRPGWVTPGQNWGPPPGQVTLRAVCLVQFPRGGLSCLNKRPIFHILTSCAIESMRQQTNSSDSTIHTTFITAEIKVYYSLSGKRLQIRSLR